MTSAPIPTDKSPVYITFLGNNEFYSSTISSG